jgi:hypothetical protein
VGLVEGATFVDGIEVVQLAAHEQRADDAQLGAEGGPQRSGLRFARIKADA